MPRDLFVDQQQPKGKDLFADKGMSADTKPSVPEDVAKSLGSGIVEGAVGLPALPLQAGAAAGKFLATTSPLDLVMGRPQWEKNVRDETQIPEFAASLSKA